MPGYYGVAPTPPRVGELWSDVRSRLDTATMQDILGGAGRIVMITADAATEPQGTEQQAWGRGVIAPVRRVFGEPESQPGRDRMVAWLVRFDIHPPGGASGYDPAIPLDAAHAEAFTRLHGWTPDDSGWSYASMDRPIWRQTDPQSLPLWDSATGVWYTSAEYRAWLNPA